jgi:hypothetical protein
LYGRKLAMKGNKPAEETFFEVSAEIPEFIRTWRIEIHTDKGETVRTLSGNGPPPARIDWDGVLDDGKPLKPGAVYHYQMSAEFHDGAKVSSPIEAFGAGVSGKLPQVQPQAIIRDRSLPVMEGRFGTDGASGSGTFIIPSVLIVRPTEAEMLEVGVGNDIYNFPPVPVVDGKINLQALDAADITFTLTGRTEVNNEIILDGEPVEVDGRGAFRQTLHLKRGDNLFSILARAPDGSQTFVEEQIAMRTRGTGDEPWEFAASALAAGKVKARDPLKPGLELDIPLLRVPVGPGGNIIEAAFSPAP